MWQDPAEKAKYEEFAQERVQLNVIDGLGLWTEHAGIVGSTSSVELSGAWLKEKLKSMNSS
jgi:hypothetical protein